MNSPHRIDHISSCNIVILHITAALGGGVVNSIAQLVQAQSADGMSVTVAHSIRSETPKEEDLQKLFPAPAKRIVLPMVTSVSPLNDFRGLIAIIRLIKLLQPDIVHLHSSKAGVLGRIASWLMNLESRTFYSPRGFSFLRLDVTNVTRQMYIASEKIASLFGGTLIACSASEAQCAIDYLAGKKVVLVENCVDTAAVLTAQPLQTDRVRVVTSGRICYQKAPWRFRQLATSCDSPNVDFVWIGDGELLQHLQVSGLMPVNLMVTGWMHRSQVFEEIARSDIFLLSSLWEGMPLSLIEAQVAGLPAVVSDVVGCRDVVKDGVTGFVCRSDDELAARLKQLIDDPALRHKMGRAAREIGLERFSIARMHREMMSVYGLSDRSGSVC